MSETAEAVQTVEAAPEARKLPELGLHDGWPDEEYFRAPGINKHSLDLIAKSPATYWFERHNPKPATPSMILGRALHCLVLEPAEFEKRFIPDKYEGSQAKEAKLWRETMRAAGVIPISTKRNEDKGAWGMSDWDEIHAMAASIHANPIAAAFLDGARTELTMFWRDQNGRGEDPTWRLCKGRADFYNEAHCLLGDVKTAADASFSGFCRAVHDYRYDVQDAWYSDGAKECGLRVDGFVFIVVEKEPPFLSACYILPPEWRAKGRALYRRDLETYHRCLKSGEWPGYEALRDLQMPNFAKYLPIS